MEANAMILGRSPVLWYALVGALLNVAVIVFHAPLSTEQVGVLNVLALTLLGVIANERDPLTVGTLDATYHNLAVTSPASSSALLPSATDSAATTPSQPSITNVIDPALASAVVALIDRLTQSAQTPTAPSVEAAGVATEGEPAVEPTDAVSSVSTASSASGVVYGDNHLIGG